MTDGLRVNKSIDGMIRPNKKISMFRVTGPKILGRVGTHIFYAPAIYNGGGHIASPLSVRPSVRTSRTYEKWFPGDIF